MAETAGDEKAGTNYHREIDGLRAVSVVAILLFHLEVAKFSGGFIGVDVFFVISGFLITRIIVSSLETGRFSFKDFYIRRSARILPALVATVGLVLPVAMYLQQPAALVHTAQEGVFALLSLSNFFYWTESSYWAPAAEHYVLLHTWSLGVEEQFYLVYPLLLAFVHRIAGVRGLTLLLFGLAILGTAANEAVLRVDRPAAFFFTPLRFYEFAFGGLVAMLPGFTALQRSSRMSGATTTVGLMLILFACVKFNGFLPLPGILVLVPVLGAMLVLLAGPSPVARIVLMNPIMSWIGKISFSLYLIHWPMVVFYKYYFGASLAVVEQCALFVAILLAGTLLNRLVEQKYRLTHDGKATASGVAARTVIIGTLAAAGLIIVASAFLILSKGWPSRMPTEARALLNLHPRSDMLKRKAFLEENCLPKGDVFCGAHQAAQRNILLLGDSRVLDMYIALKTAYPEANIQASYAMGCPAVFSPDIGRSDFFPECHQFNQARLQAVLQAPVEDIVFIAQELTEWRGPAVLETIKRLRQTGKTVYLLGDFRFLEQRSPIELSIDMLRFDSPDGDLKKYLLENPFSLDAGYADEVTALGAVYISNRNFFYDGKYHFSDRATGNLLTHDAKHLTVFGARQFGGYLSKHYPLP